MEPSAVAPNPFNADIRQGRAGLLAKRFRQCGSQILLNFRQAQEFGLVIAQPRIIGVIQLRGLAYQ